MKLTRHAENIRYTSGPNPGALGTLTFDLIVRDGNDSFTFGGERDVTAQDAPGPISIAIDQATDRILSASHPRGREHSLRGLLAIMDNKRA